MTTRLLLTEGSRTHWRGVPTDVLSCSRAPAGFYGRGQMAAESRNCRIRAMARRWCGLSPLTGRRFRSRRTVPSPLAAIAISGLCRGERRRRAHRRKPECSRNAVPGGPKRFLAGRALAGLQFRRGGRRARCLRAGFPRQGGKWQIASLGGLPPMSPNGNFLFFMDDASKTILQSRLHGKGRHVRGGQGQPWIPAQNKAIVSYDITADGQRALVLKRAFVLSDSQCPAT